MRVEADLTTMPAWSLAGWLAGALVVVVVLVAVALVDDRRERQRRQLVELPSGRKFVRCWTHACPYAGVVEVFDRHAGVELLVCVGHAHEGVARGYYRLLPARAA